MSTILVAGAGPAGSRLASKLQSSGLNVTLVESLLKPGHVAFSSAAMPRFALHEFDIPIKAVSASWFGWTLFDPYGLENQWVSESELGVVLDFGLLRKYLWQRAIQTGVEFLNGWTVISVESSHGHAVVSLRSTSGASDIRRVNWVVDATGHRRSLIGPPRCGHAKEINSLIEGKGVEWLLQGDKNLSRRWNDRLTFLMGTRWVPYGYGWIFPMGGDRMKVGVCQLPPALSYHNNSSIMIYLKGIIKHFNLGSLPVLDRHGGILSSTLYRREQHGYGRILGVGDSISTANLLGGEGIRSALLSAEVLAPLIVEACQQDGRFSSIEIENRLFRKYKKHLRRSLGWRWNISSRLAKKTWWSLDNQKADIRMAKIINGLTKNASAEDINDLLFNYKFERYGLRLLPYLFGWKA